MRVNRVLTVGVVGAALGTGLSPVQAQAVPAEPAPAASVCTGGGFNFWQDPRASTAESVFWQIYFWSCTDHPVTVRALLSDGAAPLDCHPVAPGGITNWGVFTPPQQRPVGWEYC